MTLLTSATYAGIPSDTEILITHTPPHMTLDRTRRGQHVGCEYLAQKLDQLTGCRLHVFGHIHEAHGACIVEGINDVTVERVAVNAALYNGMPAITVDLKN
jgi:Icc-related predicted phosphoesterase